MVEFDQAGTGDSRWVHSRPGRRVVSTVGQPRRCSDGVGVHDHRGWSDRRTILGVPVTSSFGWPPAAGRQRVISWVASLRVVKSHLGSPDVVCHCGWGTGDQGLFAPPSSCPHGSRGHTCRTPPWACSVSSQSDSTRKRVWWVLAELAAPRAWGSRHPTPVNLTALLDTLCRCGAPAAYTVMEPSGRAGGPVKECTSQPLDRP